MPIEADTPTRMIQSDEHVTTHNKIKMEPWIPPDKEDREPEDIRD